jgi:Cof subfamily protein (haloacid dehalogenase superfamily)
VEVVPATGRAFSALPPEFSGPDAIRGVRYSITSNGAALSEIETGELIYSKRISAEGLESVRPLLEDAEITCEIFHNGVAYVSRAAYDEFSKSGLPEVYIRYYLNTRIPVPRLEVFIRKWLREIESINLIFTDPRKRAKVCEELKSNALVDTMSSLPFNLEIGAPGMNKGEALSYLCSLLNVRREETLACGDNDNDIAMIEYAGIGVAMGQGTEGAKAAADFVTLSNDEDGVAHAIEKFVLRRDGI